MNTLPIRALLLILSTSSFACAQDDAQPAVAAVTPTPAAVTPTPTPTPTAAAAPAGNAWIDAAAAPVRTLTARGVQTYVAEPGPNGTTTWRFTGPRADLFDAAGAKVGDHFKGDTGPVWRLGDDVVVGTKTGERASPNADSIPELQLAAAPTGAGFANVVRIDRLQTKGGVAPTTATGTAPGTAVEVPYTAEYRFYAAVP